MNDLANWRFVTAAIIAGLWAGATSAATVDRDTALQAANKTRVETQLKQLETLLQSSGGFDGAAIQRVLDDPGIATTEREWVTYRFLSELRSAKPDDAIRKLVRSYLSYTPQIMTTHEEGGSHLVPLFAIPTAAQGTLNKWTHDGSRDNAAAAFDRGEFSTLSVFAMESDRFTRPVKTGLLAALGDSNTQVLDGARDWMLSHEGEADFGEALGVIAHRTRDAALFDYVLERSDGPATIRLIQSAATVLGGVDAVTVLSRCLSRDELASAALFQLGDMAPQSAQARSLVLDNLRNSNLGATAAAVIAKSADPQMLNQAASMMAEGGLTGRRALLALRLNDSPAARGMASDYLKTGDDAKLKTEVASWLGN